jgi:hypothetical protein
MGVNSGDIKNFKEVGKDVKKLVKKSEVDSKRLNFLQKKFILDEKKIKLLEEKNKELLKNLKVVHNTFAKETVEKGNKFSLELRKQVLTLSVAAFGFLAALTWRDVINAALAPILKGREGLFEFVLVALFVTGLAIIVPILLTKLLSVENEKK